MPEARQPLQRSLSLEGLAFMEQTHSDVIEVIKVVRVSP